MKLQMKMMLQDKLMKRWIYKINKSSNVWDKKVRFYKIASLWKTSIW